VEEKLVALLPLPWQDAVLTDGARVTLIGEGYVQLALYDLLKLDDMIKP